MQKRENPTVGKRQGFKENVRRSGEEKNTSYHLAGQGFCAMRPHCEFHGKRR